MNTFVNGNKAEVFTFNTLPKSVSELMQYSMTSPFETAALVVCALDCYEVQSPDNFYAMLQYLMGGAELQPMSPLTKSLIRDRMLQNGKYAFIGKSYMEGATPENNYTPMKPYTVTVSENPYSYTQQGYAKLFIRSGGADSIRSVQLRQTKTGKWVLWSDTVMWLLPDIRQPESSNPWA